LGVPLGTDAFVQKFVHDACQKMIDDVDKLDHIEDGLVHYKLLRFCQATRLQYLNSHVSLDNQQVMQQQHVDYKIAEALVWPIQPLLSVLGQQVVKVSWGSENGEAGSSGHSSGHAIFLIWTSLCMPTPESACVGDVCTSMHGNRRRTPGRLADTCRKHARGCTCIIIPGRNSF